MKAYLKMIKLLTEDGVVASDDIVILTDDDLTELARKYPLKDVEEQITLYWLLNANCVKGRPKNKSELIDQLNKWLSDADKNEMQVLQISKLLGGNTLDLATLKDVYELLGGEND